MKVSVCIFAALALFGTVGPAQSQTIPFDSDRWIIEAAEHRLLEYKGRQCLFMKGGFAYLKDSESTDGTMEFEIAFSQERGFVGAVWRMLDFANHEEFYIRPHQSGNPDANQYSPVFNGLSAWQLYHGEGYSAPTHYSFDEWIPVKIIFSGARAEIYIADLESPLFVVSDLKRDIVAGTVGLRAKNFAPAFFADFRYMPMVDPRAPVESSIDAHELNSGTIPVWEISSVFDESDLNGMPQLSAEHKATLSWNVLECEKSGLANISRLRSLSAGANCAFARVAIVSDREQFKKLAFGYSDRARVYLNDQLIYEGNNTYRSRDYRYLGTIGYFDALHLPLKQGRNELWIAVGESFGGWGVQARFEDLDGISLGE